MENQSSADIHWKNKTAIAILPEHLFQYLADFTSTRLWDPHVTDAQLIKNGQGHPISLGSQFLVDFRMGPAISQIRYEIIGFKPPHFVQFKGNTDQYTVIDTLEITPDQSNTQGSILHYSLDLKYKNTNFIKEMLGYNFIQFIAGKSFRNLNRLALADTDRVKSFSLILDKLIAPGLWQFTRFGFYQMKKKSHPLPVRAAKTCLVTGCTSGIGREIATELARTQSTLIMVNRNQEKADAFAAELKNRFGIEVHSYIADASDIPQVIATANTIAQNHPSIDVLVNNAGDLQDERTTTAEGFEHHFAVLLLTPFIFMTKLLPQLKAGQAPGPSRVINMCSGGLYTQSLHLDDLQYEKDTFNGAKAYARAKRGLLDVSQEAARLYDRESVVFHAMHPGWANTPGVAKALPGFLNKTEKVLRTPFQGADTAVWLALSESAARSSGLFWLDRKAHTTSFFPGTKTPPDQQSTLFTRLEAMVAEVKPAQTGQPVLTEDKVIHLAQGQTRKHG